MFIILLVIIEIILFLGITFAPVISMVLPKSLIYIETIVAVMKQHLKSKRTNMVLIAGIFIFSFFLFSLGVPSLNKYVSSHSESYSTRLTLLDEENYLFSYRTREDGNNSDTEAGGNGSLDSEDDDSSDVSNDDSDLSHDKNSAQDYDEESPKEGGYGSDDDDNGFRNALDDLEEDGENNRGMNSPAEFITDNVYIIIGISIIVFLGLAGVVTRNKRKNDKIMKGLRRDIYEYIKHNPGEHLSAIKYEFDMSPSTAMYHLGLLERNEKILSHKGSKYKRYYAYSEGIFGGAELRNHIGGLEYKEIVSLLKNPTRKDVVRFIMVNPNCSQGDICRALNLSASTVSWHMKKLLNAHIIGQERAGKFWNYRIQDKEKIGGTMEILNE